MTDQLDELGHELPWDRPDDVRREAVRSSLLAAVADDRLPASRRRWPLGVAFAGGVAAAAIAAVVVWPRPGAEPKHLVEVEAAPSAQLEHTTTRTASGDDELVRVHAGRIRIAVGDVRPGDRVHVATGDAEVEGAASYELVAAGDRLTDVTVQSGTAVVRVTGQKPVFLAAGQSWHAAIITTDLSQSAPVAPAPSPADNTATSDSHVATTDDNSAVATTPGDVKAPAANATSDSHVDGSTSNSHVATAAADPSRTHVVTDATSKRISDSNVAAIDNAGGRVATSNAKSTVGNTATPTTSDSTSTVGNKATSDSHVASGDTASTSNPDHTSASSDAKTTAGNTDSHVTSAADNSTTSPAKPRDVASDPAITTNPPPIVTPGTRAKTPTEKHFQSGWTLLRAGKSADAAIELGAAADASDGELASDARYFQAVALVRAGHGGEAEHALVTFLDHAPRSVRRGRAAVMLGRLIAERGDKAAARAWFESALHDPDPSVAAAAKAGIDGAR